MSQATAMSHPFPPLRGEASETDLVARALEGHPQACDQLARQFRQPCFTFALQLLGNREDARDVTQDALLRFFTTLERFDRSRPVLPWLRRIVRNRAYDLRRRRKVRWADSLDSGGPEGGGIEVAGHEVDPHRQAERHQLRMRLWETLEELTALQREIIVLRDYQDLSYREIAGVLEVPIGTVMSRLHAARRRLRSLLEPSLASPMEEQQ